MSYLIFDISSGDPRSGDLRSGDPPSADSPSGDSSSGDTSSGDVSVVVSSGDVSSGDSSGDVTPGDVSGGAFPSVVDSPSATFSCLYEPKPLLWESDICDYDTTDGLLLLILIFTIVNTAFNVFRKRG